MRQSILDLGVAMSCRFDFVGRTCATMPLGGSGPSGAGNMADRLAGALENASVLGANANDPLRDNPPFIGTNQIISSKSGSQAFPLQEEQLDRGQSLEKVEREG